MNAGYSGTPLVKKLGIKTGFCIRLLNPPPHYFNLLDNLPDALKFIENETDKIDFAHFFVNEIALFEDQLPLLRNQLKPDGMIWVSWYKKAAKKPTELTEDVVRDTALALGLVDVKVCAVDADWSGLKLVIRVRDRQKP